MPRWEPHARMRLVEAALELFEEKGYDATSVAEIAARAGLTKTTFFRQFPDKREVLFAGQEAHNSVLAEAIHAAPPNATPLAAVGAALQALAAELPPERHAFAGRLQAVIAAHSDLREREELKRVGYLDAMAQALRERAVPEPLAGVAAQLGVLSFKTAFARWTSNDSPEPSLPDLTRQALDEVQRAAAALTT